MTDTNKAAATALVERILTKMPESSAVTLRNDLDLMQAIQTWNASDIQRLPMEWREVLADVLLAAGLT